MESDFGFLNKITAFFSFEKIFVRLLSSWLISCFVTAIKSDVILTEKEFLLRENVLFSAFLTAGIFAAINAAFFIVEKKKLLKFEFDSLLLLLCLLLYFSLCLIYENDVCFALALSALATFCCVYCVNKNKEYFSRKDISEKTSKKLVLMFLGLSFAVLLIIGIFRCLTFSAPNYDLGIFTNTAYNLKTKFIQYNTCERDGLITHFQVHVSPILYLLTPFYALFPSAITLQVIQATLIASCVIPVYLLCKSRSVSNRLTAAICFMSVFFPALSTGTFYDFHENAFLTPLILWMLYFYEKKKYVPMFVFAVLTLTVKEDASVYIAFFGLYLLTRKNQRIKGMALTLLSVAYIFVCVYFINKYGFGAMTGRFKEYITNERSGLIGILATVILDPAYVIKNSISAEKLIFILQVFSPLLFLPLITKKYSRYILLLPFVLMNLMPSYQYQHSIHFQYLFGVIAFLLYLSIVNLSEMTSASKTAIISCCLCVTTLCYCAFVLPKTYYISKYFNERENFIKTARVLDAIPEDADVTAPAFYVAYLANRDVIYETEYTDETTQYIVFDLRYEADKKRESELDLSKYELVEKLPELVAVYKIK